MKLSTAPPTGHSPRRYQIYSLLLFKSSLPHRVDTLHRRSSPQVSTVSSYFQLQIHLLTALINRPHFAPRTHHDISPSRLWHILLSRIRSPTVTSVDSSRRRLTLKNHDLARIVTIFIVRPICPRLSHPIESYRALDLRDLVGEGYTKYDRHVDRG
jgi:hypothetical protein